MLLSIISGCSDRNFLAGSVAPRYNTAILFSQLDRKIPSKCTSSRALRAPFLMPVLRFAVHKFKDTVKTVAATSRQGNCTSQIDRSRVLQRIARGLTVACLAFCTMQLRAQEVGDVADAPAEEAGEIANSLHQHNEGGRAPYRLGLEDVIEVDVWRNPELKQEHTVRPDGRIAFRLVGEVQVEGMTIPELRVQLTKMYRDYVPAAEVSVILQEINSFKVYVLGRIEKPGEYRVASGITMLKVLAMAGPFSAYANSKEIKVFRRRDGRDTILTFNYRELVRGNTGDLELEPGDRVVVP